MTGTARLLEWRFRLATCRFRALPNFLIIGAPRTGTTSLYHYLLHQPPITPSFRKEVHFFSRSAEFQRGPCRYKANFPVRARMRENEITGEATPTYLLRPDVPLRVAETVPDVKLIVILRDPIERAISSWSHFRRLGEEPRSLEVAIAEEIAALGDPSTDPGPAPEARPGSLDFAHVHYGRYADHLRRWFATFERDQFLIITSEHLFENPEEAYVSTLSHLGVPLVGLPEFKRLNEAPREAYSDQARQMLREYFEGPNADLESLIGVGAGWSS